jgi:hypothetical protein
MDVLAPLVDHPCYADAVAVLPALLRCAPGHTAMARACSDGSIALEVRGDGWRALVTLEPEPEESGWVWVCVAGRKVGTPELEVGRLDEMDKLGMFLAKTIAG